MIEIGERERERERETEKENEENDFYFIKLIRIH